MKNTLSLTGIFRCAVLLLLLALPEIASGLQIDAKEWSEDALLHDGRIIKIARKVDSTLESRLEIYILIPYNRITSNPDRFWLSFEHPDSKERITWQGEQYFNPVMLDIVDGIPYLVVKGLPHMDNTQKKIINDSQEFPYIFLRYESGFFGKWIQIPVEQFPSILLDANLSPRDPEFSQIIPGGEDEAGIERPHGRPLRKTSPDDVIKNIRKVERSSQKLFQSKIRRSYDEWSRIKNIQAPRQPTSYDRMPPPQEVAFEILETKDYTPEWVMSEDEWSQFLSNKNNDCSKLIKWPRNNEDKEFGEFFVNDPTGQKEVPYVELSSIRFCEGDYIWFIAHKEQRGKIVLTKYTTSGDFLYRISLSEPEDLLEPKGVRCFYEKMPVFRSEKGYLYFDWRYWRHYRDGKSGRFVKRDLTVRLSEPKATAPIATVERNDRQIPQGNKTSQKVNQPGPPTTFRDCPTCPEMVKIPGKEYAIGKYEVTRAEWKAVMDKNINEAPTTRGSARPIVRVDREQVQRYITQLNQITGQNYRLPTGAEWEHACYGGTQTDYCGGNVIEAVAWWGGEGIHSVGQKQPNSYGLYDMSGNVWEWVDDCWKGNCELQVIRGGSFFDPPLRVPEAHFYGKKTAGEDIGFRLLRMLPSGAK